MNPAALLRFLQENLAEFQFCVLGGAPEGWGRWGGGRAEEEEKREQLCLKRFSRQVDE